VCLAIEELAGRPPGGDESSAVRLHAQDSGAAGGDMAARLAAIWAMIAEADPELARRLPGYLNVRLL